VLGRILFLAFYSFVRCVVFCTRLRTSLQGSVFVAAYRAVCIKGCLQPLKTQVSFFSRFFFTTQTDALPFLFATADDLLAWLLSPRATKSAPFPQLVDKRLVFLPLDK